MVEVGSTGVPRYSESDSKSVVAWQSGGGDIARRIRKVCKNAVVVETLAKAEVSGRTRRTDGAARAKGKIRKAGSLYLPSL